MILIAMWMLLIIAIDLCTDWVTPYLKQVEQERGPWAAVIEAFKIIEEGRSES